MNIAIGVILFIAALVLMFECVYRVRVGNYVFGAVFGLLGIGLTLWAMFFFMVAGI